MPTIDGSAPSGGRQRHGERRQRRPRLTQPAGHAGRLGGRRRTSRRARHPLARHRERVAGGAAHLELEAVGAVAQGHADPAGGRRRDRVLDDPVRRQLDAVGQRAPLALDVQARRRRAGRRAGRASAAARVRRRAARRAARASRSATRGRGARSRRSRRGRRVRPARSSSACARGPSASSSPASRVALDRDRQLRGPLALVARARACAPASARGDPLARAHEPRRSRTRRPRSGAKNASAAGVDDRVGERQVRRARRAAAAARRAPSTRSPSA